MERTLDDWNDETSHQEWLRLRQTTRHVAFDIPEKIKNDALERLHRVIMRNTQDGKSPTPDDDERAIKAITALTRLATVTTTANTVQAKLLDHHTAAHKPLSTHPDDVKWRNVLSKINS